MYSGFIVYDSPFNSTTYPVCFLLIVIPVATFTSVTGAVVGGS